MSDSRREIAERLLNSHRYFCSVDTMIVGTKDVESAMSEHTAAVLEDVARQTAAVAESMSCTDDEKSVEQFAEMLRARAEQERQK